MNEIIAGVADDMDAIAAGLARRLREELAEYSVVPIEESRDFIVREFRSVFAGMIEGRPPNPDEAAHSRSVGRHRAEQGLPVQTVLSAYHMGTLLAWDEIRARTLARAPELMPELLPVVNALMEALRSFSLSIVEGYETAAATRRTSRVALMQTLLTGLLSGRPDGENQVVAARLFGFDPDGEFQAACGPADQWPPDRLGALQDRLMTRTALVAPAGTSVFLLGQNIPESELARLFDAGPMAGFGMVRQGLTGAAESLIDAERALALAERRGEMVRFEDAWLRATVLPHLPRLWPLLDAGPAASQPHLAEAVNAYAENGFSISEAARFLHIHPNTVKYRLDRWHELTGWDPRTLGGLLRSLFSI
ncbi:helix-turn-helix domain-containing protein [Micromonospora ureilytica]|uniref:PucR family transcriptional regulator n=1 Tax=Micromonospora ureilytica TaxID=709868 RepID=UPI0033F8C794